MLPSSIILALQVYISYASATSVSHHYIRAAKSNYKYHTNDLLPNLIDSGINAAVISKRIPEVSPNRLKLDYLRNDELNNHIDYSSGSGENLIADALSRAENDNQSSSSSDFDTYSVTMSPALFENANDKNLQDLEDKIEMHTNNHQSSSSSNQAGSSSLGATSGGQISRHYNSYQPNLYHSSKYSSSSSANGFSNNLNLKYVHSLFSKPSSSSSSSSSLANLMYGLLPSTNAHSYYSSSPVISSASMPKHQYQQSSTLTSIGQQDSPATDTSILDLSSGSAICGKQQVLAASSREPRIVGGNTTYDGEFPWAVSIQRHGNHHCGGVIVGKRWILTAAHCVRSQLVGNLIVRTGGNTLSRSNNHISSHLERDYIVDQIVMHGDFSRYDNLTASKIKSSANTNNADIALLRLKNEIYLNELAWPVCFPPRESGNFSGHDAIVIGWGKLNEKSEEFSNELQKVKLTIIDNKVCQNWFRQAGREMPIDDRIICAGFKNGGKDACHGDSGGPLLSKINGHYAVVGVVSTGIGCARPLLPGLYSRVSSYIGWIERHISN